MATSLRYRGKVAIVTGGTAGIGLAIVREFVRQGAHVVFCSRARGEEKGHAIERELQASGCAGDAYYQVCDVRKESDIQRLIQVTLERYGCLDCLVNNAGVDSKHTIDDVSAQNFHNYMDVHVLSCLLASKYALPYLRETKGNIVNMASMAGVLGKERGVLYASAKGAVIGMTKALAIDESENGVRVNSQSRNWIDPTFTPGFPNPLPFKGLPYCCFGGDGMKGYVWTPLTEKLANESPNPELTRKKISSYQLMGRYGKPEEVAKAVLYLAAEGTFCTGLNLMVSGGEEVGFGKKSQVDSEPEPSAAGNSQGSSSKQ